MGIANLCDLIELGTAIAKDENIITWNLLNKTLFQITLIQQQCSYYTKILCSCQS